LGSKAASVSDYRALARARVPHFLFEYLDGGSYDEVTLRRNVEDLQSIALKQRVLRDVSSIDLSTELFGRRWSMPVGLGPVGLSGLYARRGEVQAAKAAAAANVPFTLSTVSACSIEEVARGSGHPFWLQLYVIRDRGFMRELIARARDAQCEALLFTVDLPTPGSRYRDYRSGLTGSHGLGAKVRRFGQLLSRPDWLWDVGVHGRPHSMGNLSKVVAKGSGLSDFGTWIADNFDPSMSWKDIEWIRSEWPGPLVL
jgi:L-lactate dehydrogenase (cytochrome)